MNPILYNASETAFVTNGIGILTDAIDVTVEEELNGIFELEMRYPVKGIHFSEIVRRSIILAEPNPMTNPQPFRVYRITKPLNGIVSVYARHIAYDLQGIPVSPFSVSGAALALQNLKNYAVADCPFEFTTNKSADGTMTVAVPSSIWSLLGGQEGSVLDVFGGEYEFDRYKVNLLTRRGADRGVSIRYGKNLTSFEQDENCANCCTGLYPYWADPDGNLVELTEKVVHAEGNYGYTKILPKDFSSDFENAPTEDQLRARAEKYIADNEIGIPDISWTVEFVALEQTEEYKGSALLERIQLGDTVSVEFGEMGVSASARAVSYKYKPLLERYEKVTLGRVKSNLAETIVKQKQEIEKKAGTNAIKKAADGAAKAILGATGGTVRIMDTDGDGKPDTIYIADKEDPAKAQKVWRWNYEGWAASKTGYDGPFTMSATLAEGLVADFVTAAHLVAGTIENSDGSLFIDLDNGIIRMQALDDVEAEVEELAEAILEIDGTYFYVRYSQYEDGTDMTEIPDDNTEYMGVCSTSTNTAPTDNSAYTWVKVKGNDGVGLPGNDGKTSYFHVKYSDDGKTFTGNMLPVEISGWESGYYNADGKVEQPFSITSPLIPVTAGAEYKVYFGSAWRLGVTHLSGEEGMTYIVSTANADAADNAIFSAKKEATFVRIRIISADASATFETFEAAFASGEIVPAMYPSDRVPGEELGAYIGTLVDFVEEDSTTFSDYTWKKFTEDVDEELDEIKRTVQEQYTQIITDTEQIVLSALESYVETSNYEEFRKSVESQLQLLADQMTLKFTETTSQIEEVNGDLQTKFNTITKYFTFDINGMTIGASDNPNKVVIDNDEISILVNGIAVQRFDANGKAEIPELNIVKSLSILGYLIEEDADGNVNCEYIGTVGLQILKQPEDQTVAVGETATFSIQVKGEGISYQWQYNNSGVWRTSTSASAKTANYTITPSSTGVSGELVRCIITDSDGNQITSDTATLYVTE